MVNGITQIQSAMDHWRLLIQSQDRQRLNQALIYELKYFLWSIIMED